MKPPLPGIVSREKSADGSAPLFFLPRPFFMGFSCPVGVSLDFQIGCVPEQRVAASVTEKGMGLVRMEDVLFFSAVRTFFVSVRIGVHGTVRLLFSSKDDVEKGDVDGGNLTLLIRPGCLLIGDIYIISRILKKKSVLPLNSQLIFFGCRQIEYLHLYTNLHP